MLRPILLAVACALCFSPPGTGSENAVKHRILFAEYGKGPNRLVELDADGKLVWEYKLPSISVIFQVLASGNIVYAYGGNPTGVAEINRDGKIVWNYVSKCPQVLGCQRLPSGNTVFCVYLGHGHLGEQPQVIEVTRDKRVVWQVADHAQFKTINQIQLLDVKGDVTKGEILR